MRAVHEISSRTFSLGDLRSILEEGKALSLSGESRKKIAHCRDYVEKKITHSDALMYGINTGLGDLCNVKISDVQLEELQANLVRSHACGTGEVVPEDITRIILLLKIQSLSYGFSGIRVELVEKLISFYNEGITPVIYQQGSLGASGDLSPLAHMSLVLMGEGEVWQNGKVVETADSGLVPNPLVLRSKEGLALLNGTQFSTAYAAWCITELDRLFEIADVCAALSVDAFNCRLSPFNALVHGIRPHVGQKHTAKRILALLAGSEMAEMEKTSVQDAYAFRCTPQVHGASKDALQHVRDKCTTEMNSVTDNPNVFPDEDLILSAGNFHAQPLALALDYLAIASAEIGSISERRTFQLLSGKRGLPAFLTPTPGLHSGLMIPQYTAASIASQNKQLCSPASVDNVVSSNGQEDHVSMAANAGTKAYRVVENLERLLAIEFMTAAQAMEFRRPKKTSPRLEALLSKYRTLVPALGDDRFLHKDIKKTIRFLKEIKPVL